MSFVGRIVSSLLAFLLMSACAGARPAPPSARTDAGLATYVLPNGITVIIEEHRAGDVAALQLWVKAGGRDEAATELGLAHYLEHMLFKGTTTRPPGFVDRDIEGVGGRVNAGTSLDYTYYHTVLPARLANSGIEMLADVSVNAALDSALLDHEKSVVLEEMRLNDDNPRRFLGRQLYGVVFEGHPYGRPVIGIPDLIRNLSRDTLAGFYRRHYIPEAFTLVVVGAVDPVEMKATIARTFGRLPRSGYTRLPAPVPPPPRARRDEITRPGAHAYLGMAWIAPRIDHVDTAAVDLLVSILGQTRSSRLTQAVQERLGLATSIGSGYSALEAAGLVTVNAQLDPANLERTETEILREIARLRDEGVSQAERRRAVTSAEAQHEFSIETAEGRAFALGRASTVWRLEDELAYVDRLRSVTSEQIRAAARRYLDPARYARVALLPPAQP